ncbi:MAG: FecR domain-containing protein [Candidatus Marinimicrobia bacterium]|nr:FecR domain-containing protein [Candidatus Neomarinimicrobiota bacterium]
MNMQIKWLNEKLMKGWISNKHRYSMSKQALEEMNTIWEQSSKIELPEPPDTGIAWQQLELAIDRQAVEQQVVIKTRRIPRTVQVAFVSVMIACLVLISPVVLTWLTTTTFSTANSEQLTITFPDSSSAQLNYASKLLYKKGFNDTHRELSLTGEAYFDVRHNSLPFIIRLDEATITVIGTEFNVKARDNEYEIVVNDGVITISSKIDSIDTVISIKKGEFVRFTGEEFQDSVQGIPFDNYPGWIHGKLIFNQTDLLTVCKEIERKYDISIELADTSLAIITVTGVIETTDLDSTMMILSSLVQRKIVGEKKKYTIY